MWVAGETKGSLRKTRLLYSYTKIYVYTCIHGVLWTKTTTVVMLMSSSVNMIELVWFEMERRNNNKKKKCQTQRRLFDRLRLAAAMTRFIPIGTRARAAHIIIIRGSAQRPTEPRGTHYNIISPISIDHIVTTREKLAFRVAPSPYYTIYVLKNVRRSSQRQSDSFYLYKYGTDILPSPARRTHGNTRDVRRSPRRLAPGIPDAI